MDPILNNETTKSNTSTHNTFFLLRRFCIILFRSRSNIIIAIFFQVSYLFQSSVKIDSVEKTNEKNCANQYVSKSIALHIGGLDFFFSSIPNTKSLNGVSLLKIIQTYRWLLNNYVWFMFCLALINVMDDFDTLL